MVKLFTRLSETSRKLLTMAALLAGSTAVQAQEMKLNVLFLGNSYTGLNDLPLLVDQIARSMKDTLVYDSNVPGSYTLEAHYGDAASLGRIYKGDWNYVVLQEQSQRPALPDPQVEVQVYPFAHLLDSIVHNKNKCARTVFFMTWGYPDGDASTCATFPPTCNYRGMDSLIHKRYTEMAIQNNALLSPVGQVFKELMTTSPGINLFDADRMHPSQAGSYAAALTFYTVLYRKDPMMVSFNHTLTPTEALEVKHAVQTIVFSALPKWHVGQYDPKVGFTASVASPDVTFSSSTSHNVVNYLWNFGDGTTSTDPNPVHTYSTSGIFNVTLYGDDCILKDSAKSTVEILKTAISESLAAQELRLFPNPAGSMLYLESASGVLLRDAAVSIHNLVGVKVYDNARYSGAPIQIGNLAPGMYLLQVRESSGHMVTRKFTKE